MYQRGSLLDGLAMYLSCDAKKFHDNESTHILHNFWTSTHRGEASSLPPLAAPLTGTLPLLSPDQPPLYPWWEGSRQFSATGKVTVSMASRRPRVTGNESVPIQLAQCWFPFPMPKYEYIFQIKSYVRKHFYRTALGNCYGLKLARC